MTAYICSEQIYARIYDIIFSQHVGFGKGLAVYDQVYKRIDDALWRGARASICCFAMQLHLGMLQKGQQFRGCITIILSKP